MAVPLCLRFYFQFSGSAAKVDLVKATLCAALILLGAVAARPQEAELAPIVVTGTFELREGPSVTDLFTLHLQTQIDARRAVEESQARSPWFYSQLWKYWVIPLGSSSPDPDLFFKPQYLTLENQRTDWELRKTEKQSLFERR